MNGRRTFVRHLALGLVAAPLVVEAQQAGKVWRIGFLYADQKVKAAGVLQPFLDGMRQLGYVEGKNLKVEVAAAEGHLEDLPALAAQLVRAKPDVIVVINSSHASLVQKLTKTLPIVTLTAGELVSNGWLQPSPSPGAT